MEEQDLVRVRLRVRTEEGTSEGEVLWASLEPGVGASTYRLQNHAFLVALAAGDLVRAEPDGSGVLEVVDIVQPVDAVLTLVGRVWDATADLDAVMARWQEAGARWSEGAAGAVATVWAEGMSPQAVIEVMRPDLEAGSFELLEVSLPEHRTMAALTDELDVGGLIDG